MDEAAMGRTAYDDLAQVYDWLVPGALFEPTRAAAAFDAVLERIQSGGRVPDCACGTDSSRWEQPCGREGIVVRAWTLGEGWDDEHRLEVAVALPEPDGTVRTMGERLTFWPFTHVQLDDDLRAAGLEPVSSTVDPQSDRYLVLARHRRPTG